MAVGANEIEPGATDRAVKTGAWLSVGVFALGFVVRSSRLRHAGAGAALALFAVQLATGGMGTKVAVTT